MTSPGLLEVIASALFALALIHTFSTRIFERLARKQPRHAGLWHLLAEVEIVFGFWAMVLFVTMLALYGKHAATDYLATRSFIEPLFVFAVMVIAASRPILQLAAGSVNRLAARLPLPKQTAFFLICLSLLPLMGSFITEPAAMTVAALMLKDRIFSQALSERFKYATIGTLFVNISIGGLLTPFAAPPVLMVAGSWGWDIPFMMSHFGWKAALAVGINAAILTWLFRTELAGLSDSSDTATNDVAIPKAITATHVGFLAAAIVFAHYPEACIGLLMAFIGFTHAYRRYQSPLMVSEALLVAFFLSGLVVLGGLQTWWLQPLLLGMNDDAVFFGAMALTALTDNAALTYLGSLVDGLSPSFQYALVAGAVAGGGLTVIANAPNPAGLAILKPHFEDETVAPLFLLLAALPPSLCAALLLWWL